MLGAVPAPPSATERTNGRGAHRVLVHAALLAVQIAFASLSVVGKVVLRSVEPSALALLRVGGAAAVFWLVLARAGADPRRPMPARDVLAIAGCAALGIFGNQVLFLYGLRATTATNATVLVATIPVFTVLVAIVLGRERARARTIGAVGLAFGGVLWLVGGDVALGGETALGDVLVVANALAYAFYLVLVRELVRRYGSLRVVAVGFAAATLYALPFGGPVLAAQAPSISRQIWALVGYVVLVATVFTYLANAWALRHASATTVAIYIYVQPTVAALLAWVVLGDVPSPRLAITALAVFAGIWLASARADASSKSPCTADRACGAGLVRR